MINGTSHRRFHRSKFHQSSGNSIESSIEIEPEGARSFLTRASRVRTRYRLIQQVYGGSYRKFHQGFHRRKILERNSDCDVCSMSGIYRATLRRPWNRVGDGETNLSSLFLQECESHSADVTHRTHSSEICTAFRTVSFWMENSRIPHRKIPQNDFFFYLESPK